MIAKKLFSLYVVLFFCGCADQPKSVSSLQDIRMSHEARLAEVTKRASQIKTGMTRLEVEKIFLHPDGGISGPNSSRYYEDPEVKIEVPFDQTGGDWKPQNRVTGPVRIYREPMFAD